MKNHEIRQLSTEVQSSGFYPNGIQAVRYSTLRDCYLDIPQEILEDIQILEQIGEMATVGQLRTQLKRQDGYMQLNQKFTDTHYKDVPEQSIQALIVSSDFAEIQHRVDVAIESVRDFCRLNLQQISAYKPEEVDIGAFLMLFAKLLLFPPIFSLI